MRQRADCDVSYSLSLSIMQEAVLRPCMRPASSWCRARCSEILQIDPLVLAFLHNTSFRSRQPTEGTSSSADR